jgi:hypothetical protein
MLLRGNGFVQPNKALVRQAENMIAHVDIHATVAHAKTAAVTNVTAAAIGNIGNLADLAAGVAKQSPSAAVYCEGLVRSAAIGMSSIISDVSRL